VFVLELLGVTDRKDALHVVQSVQPVFAGLAGGVSAAI